GAPVDPGLWSSLAMTINGTYNGDWIGWNRAYVYPTTRSDVNETVETSRFDPGAFVAPPVGIPPRPARSSLRGGGLQNWDMSLFKNIPLGTGSRYLQLRLEAFNVFNHPNFSNVNLNWAVNPPSGTQPPTLTINTRPEGDQSHYGSYFGEYSNTYTGTGGPRVIQLAVKVYF
ncbi:MAG: hypothetical protein ACRD2X_07580, partial [Vicinamibacteraceae bacterium]